MRACRLFNGLREEFTSGTLRFLWWIKCHKIRLMQRAVQIWIFSVVVRIDPAVLLSIQIPFGQSTCLCLAARSATPWKNICKWVSSLNCPRRWIWYLQWNRANRAVKQAAGSRRTGPFPNGPFCHPVNCTYSKVLRVRWSQAPTDESPFDLPVCISKDSSAAQLLRHRYALRFKRPAQPRNAIWAFLLHLFYYSLFTLFITTPHVNYFLRFILTQQSSFLSFLNFFSSTDSRLIYRFYSTEHIILNFLIDFEYFP